MNKGMVLFLSIALIVLVNCSTVFAQGSDDYLLWQQLDTNAKIFYVKGFYEGMKGGIGIACGEMYKTYGDDVMLVNSKLNDEYDTRFGNGGITYAMMSQVFDLVYSVEEQRKLTLREIMSYIIMIHFNNTISQQDKDLYLKAMLNPEQVLDDLTKTK